MRIWSGRMTLALWVLAILLTAVLANGKMDSGNNNGRNSGENNRGDAGGDNGDNKGDNRGGDSGGNKKDNRGGNNGGNRGGHKGGHNKGGNEEDNSGDDSGGGTTNGGRPTERNTNCPSGWTGDSCNTPVCNPECSEHGTCVNPNECSCDDGYVGSACEDYAPAISDTSKYCYAESTCVGAKPDNVDFVVSMDDCCSIYGGNGWGLSDGSDCEPCFSPPQNDGAGSYSPDQPADASTEREGNARARAPGRSWSADRIWPSERIQTEKPVKRDDPTNLKPELPRETYPETQRDDSVNSNPPQESHDKGFFNFLCRTHVQ